MIRVDGLHKSFGDVKAVRGVSFHAEDGKITGLLGPNGAGKSTTLRILYTVLTPDVGSAEIDGVNVAHIARMQVHLIGHFGKPAFIAAQHVVDADDVPALTDQLLDQIGADEPAAAGDNASACHQAVPPVLPTAKYRGPNS